MKLFGMIRKGEALRRMNEGAWVTLFDVTLCYAVLQDQPCCPVFEGFSQAFGWSMLLVKGEVKDEVWICAVNAHHEPCFDLLP